QVYGPLKERFARPRPYDADVRVAPAVAREPSFAFPSGHAVRGVLHALLLAELAPARREALLERGRQIGFDRVRGGVHWPSDVEAGQRLGGALAAARLADPRFRARLEAAREKEWAAERR
ncbi:MAG TPA: phosphatase PAP2 family protein, partial [Anaeromyxobacteraceae bacterium]